MALVRAYRVRTGLKCPELARDGLVGLGYTPAEAEQLLGDADSELPEELIAEALKRAGEARSAA